MKDRINKLQKLFYNKKAFEACRKAAIRRNASALKIALACSVLLFTVSLTVTFINKFNDGAYMRYAYLAIIAVSLVLLLLLWQPNEKMTIIGTYVGYGVFIAYATIASAFMSPDYTCVTVLAVIVILQTIFLDCNSRINAATFISAAFYIAFVFPFKDPRLITDEIMNTIVFSFLACTIGMFIRRTQFDNYEMQEYLRMSEEQYRLVLSHSDNIMCRYIIAERKVILTPGIAKKLHTTEVIEDVPYGSAALSLVASESRDAYVKFYELMMRGVPSGSATFKFLDMSSGKWSWLRATYTTVFSDAGEPTYSVATFKDITNQREMELTYEKWKIEVAAMPRAKTALFEWNLTQDASEGASGELISIFKDLTENSFNGRTDMYVRSHVHPDDAAKYAQLLNREQLLVAYYDGKNYYETDFREILSDGSFRWLHLTLQLVPYPDSKDVMAYLIFTDIDDEKRRTLATETMARLDVVTKLINRATFINEATELISKTEAGTYHAFMMLDVDNFKSVNDNFGHIAGDRRLLDTADILRIHMTKNDIIGRFGGDEFAVCMTKLTSFESVEARAKELCYALHRDIGNGIVISASIGIALFPQDADNFEELYKKADIALYKAKKEGKNRFLFYDKSMDSTAYVSSATPID